MRPAAGILFVRKLEAFASRRGRVHWIRDELEICFGRIPGRVAYELGFRIGEKRLVVLGATVLGGLIGAAFSAAALAWSATSGFLVGLYAAAHVTARRVDGDDA